MEATLYWALFVPAVLALAIKIGFFLYAYAHRSFSSAIRLYLCLLGALSFQNVVIITGYSTLIRGVVPVLEANLFYVAMTFAIVLILHLATTLAFDQETKFIKWLLGAAYLFAFTLTLLILNTRWVISGYDITNYIITRIPGPMFFLFNVYALGSLAAAVAALCYGAFFQTTIQRRLKNQFLLLAVIPMALTVTIVLTLLQFGIKIINVSILAPILITYFLIVTGYAIYPYAIHQPRLFDIRFFVPWSKVRKRKTAFYVSTRWPRRLRIYAL